MFLWRLLVRNLFPDTVIGTYTFLDKEEERVVKNTNTEEVPSNATKQKVAAAKQYTDGHYKKKNEKFTGEEGAV